MAAGKRSPPFPLWGMARHAGGEGRWVANAGRNLSGEAWEGGQAALVVAISAFACEARERRGGSKLSANSEESEEWSLESLDFQPFSVPA